MDNESGKSMVEEEVDKKEKQEGGIVLEEEEEDVRCQVDPAIPIISTTTSIKEDLKPKEVKETIMKELEDIESDEEEMICDDDDDGETEIVQSEPYFSTVEEISDKKSKEEDAQPDEKDKDEATTVVAVVSVESPPSPSTMKEDNVMSSKTSPPAAEVPRAGSPIKKIIHLNPAVLPNIFKSPPKEVTSVTAAVPDKNSDAGNKNPEFFGGGDETTPAPSRNNNSEFLKASLALAAALKSQPKTKVFCANTNCNAKTDTVLEAPSYAKLYFGMKIKCVVNPKICVTCFKKAEIFHQKSKQKIIDKDNLFDLKCEIQTASSEAMIDLDSPVGSPGEGEGHDGEPSEGEFYQMDELELEEIIKEKLSKFEVVNQVGKCKDTLTKEVDDLSYQFNSLDMQLDQLRNQIENTTKQYNENLAAKPKVIEIGGVELHRGNITVTPNENLPKIAEDLSRIDNQALKRALVNLNSLNNVNAAGWRGPNVRDLPPPGGSVPGPGAVAANRRMGKLIFVKPKEGQDVFAMHKHSLFYWLPAKILKIYPLAVPTVYSVQFQEKVRQRNKAVDEFECFKKDVTGKQLAFKKPSSVILPVGTRIIGKFKDLLKSDAEVDGRLYAGVVAEIPREVNRMRYLVFFDDGYAQYVSPHELYPVVESSPDVWLDVHKYSQEFIREYIVTFPNRHMIRAEIGATFTVELNGQWLLARIADVDSSLLKMQYLRRIDNSPEFEWIYRGSTRLGPLYSRLKSLQARPTLNVARRHTYASRRANFSFEVNRDGVEEIAQSSSGIKVAKKHTGFDGAAGAAMGGVIRAKNGMVISTVLESQGNMIKIQIPRDCPTPRAYTPHSCGVECAHRYDNGEYRKVSPLAIPFYLGWAREMAGPNRDKVYYHTPCGLRLGTYPEIHVYITTTGSEIPIDFFSLEPNIDCLNEFEPERKIEYLKDISYGKEWAPISCVNSLDRDLPAYMEYMTARIPGKGVVINDDDDFLVCCDCEDDCSNKDKCACWQMTFAGVSFKLAAKEGTDLQGYENRRLKNHVLSGIYECNRKCKCRSTCFNRVVQNKVKWPIQMFKTVAKGWGVRALHDMPQGSFICVYTGQLLTDAGANESGIEVGDEYLAELDFIECNEQIKEDYESDCTDLENEEPGTKSTARLISKANGTAAEQSKQMVAKKATIQKAVKSTGGMKRKIDEEKTGYLSDATTISCSTTDDNSSKQSVGQATARKSGSKNGVGKSDKNNKSLVGSFSSSSGGGIPTPPGSSTSSTGGGNNKEEVGVRTRRSRRSASKDESEFDSDDDDLVQVYSSFSASASSRNMRNAPRLPLREYFGKDEAVYIMDAKSMGNFGRYLNHSCEPNVFVQNLFVDTQDPRFPWVAFFTKKDVKAGTELTWDYNYDIGSVPGKTLYCYCLQPSCRGRLL